MSREADLLEAMARATLPEQRRIQAELQEIRGRRTAAVRADRETDLGAEIARDHLTPVFVHGRHTASTDWLDEIAPNFTQADLKSIDRTVRAEAASWFRTVHTAVRADQSEFAEQARGIAHRTASQYGTLAPQVGTLFLRHVASLYRIAEGTDLAGVPSAADGETNPNATDWSAEPESTGAGAAPGYENPPGIDAFPEQVGDDGGTKDSEPSDSAPTSAPAVDADDTLDVTDSNNAAGSTQAEVSQATASYLDKPSVWSSAARSFLGVEEGQAPPVPGEADEEQSGEAGTTLPRSVEVSSAPETMDNFITFNKEDAAAVSSERAKNITSAFQAFAESVEEAASDEDPDPDHDGDDDRPGSTDNPDESEDEKKQVESRRYFASDDPADTDDDQEPNWDRMRDYYGDDSKKEAVATGPNPYGSFVYDAQRVVDLGYKEGYRYAVLWTPGKPVPAALSSSAQLGDKYNSEYVQGYKEGVAAAVGQMPATTKAAWSKAATQVSMTAAADYHRTPPRKTDADWGKGPSVDEIPGWTESYNGNDNDDDEADGHGVRWDKESRRRSAALPQLELSDMDSTVSNPWTLADSSGGVDGKGAADVANVPTPGKSVGDYPAPSGVSQEPAIGDASEEADEWEGQEDSAAKAAAFRARVQAGLRRESAR